MPSPQERLADADRETRDYLATRFDLSDDAAEALDLTIVPEPRRGLTGRLRGDEASNHR